MLCRLFRFLILFSLLFSPNLNVYVDIKAVEFPNTKTAKAIADYIGGRSFKKGVLPRIKIVESSEVGVRQRHSGISQLGRLIVHFFDNQLHRSNLIA